MAIPLETPKAPEVTKPQEAPKAKLTTISISKTAEEVAKP